MSATEAALAPGLWPTAMLRAAAAFQVDAVIAGAVADDRAQLRKQVHRLRIERACRPR